MSANGNQWKPNRPEKVEDGILPSGSEVFVRQPGPEFTLKLGRAPRRFTTGGSELKRKEGQSDEDFAEDVMERISDDDLVESARELLVAMVVSPKLKLNPDYDKGEIGPDDTGDDFWPLYQYGMRKYFSRKGKVQIGGGEVEATDLETFRAEPGVSGDRMGGVHVPVTESERTVTDSGLVDSAGA